jgi:hypothetical protein
MVSSSGGTTHPVCLAAIVVVYLDDRVDLARSLSESDETDDRLIIAGSDGCVKNSAVTSGGGGNDSAVLGVVTDLHRLRLLFVW